MIRRLIFLVALVAACASTRAPQECPDIDAAPYSFFPAVGFEAAEQDAMTAAMKQWNDVTNADHRLGWSDYGHLRVIPYRPPHEGFSGQWWDIGVVFVAPGAESGEVALHEFGHAIGLWHVGEPSAVMCSSADFDVACEPHVTILTTADITECRRVGACP